MTIVEDCRRWADRFRREVAVLLEWELHTGGATAELSELVEQYLEESSVYARAADEIERLRRIEAAAAEIIRYEDSGPPELHDWDAKHEALREALRHDDR